MILNTFINVSRHNNIQIIINSINCNKPPNYHIGRIDNNIDESVFHYKQKSLYKLTQKNAVTDRSNINLVVYLEAKIENTNIFRIHYNWYNYNDKNIIPSVLLLGVPTLYDSNTFKSSDDNNIKDEPVNNLICSMNYNITHKNVKLLNRILDRYRIYYFVRLYNFICTSNINFENKQSKLELLHNKYDWVEVNDIELL